MSKVLLIEPHKVLRQAISLSLFPEHDVRAEESVDVVGVDSLNEYDLLIVDGAALREHAQLTPEVMRSIQDCQAAILWLEDDDWTQSPEHRKLVRMTKPIEKGKLQSALSELLPPDKSSKSGSASDVRGLKAGGRRAASDPQGAEVSDQGAFEFIDLVDIVDEGSSPKQEKNPDRRSKISK